MSKVRSKDRPELDKQRALGWRRRGHTPRGFVVHPVA